MKAAKFIRRNVYRWHRITSLLIALPVLLWTISGFLHPVMGSFKPRVNNLFLPTEAIDLEKTGISLGEALRRNEIDSIRNFRIICWDKICYYQVKLFSGDSLVYLDCINGKKMENGDSKYAAHLAQRYLSEPGQQKNKDGHSHHGAAADAGFVLSAIHAENISRSSSGIKSVEFLQHFTPEYKRSNVLLPVYRVNFDRGDNIRLYIETSTDRLAVAIDDKKAWFTGFFSWTHSWSFLDSMGRTKNVLLGSVSFLCFLSSLAGFYVYNLTSAKKQSGKRNKNRYAHRILGNLFVLTTLLYALSGAWHSFQKLPVKSASLPFMPAAFRPDQLEQNFNELSTSVKKGEKVTGVSIIHMYGRNYWQIDIVKGKEKFKKYLDIQNLSELKDGDETYGRYMACLYSGNHETMIRHSQFIRQYNNRYSMMKRRLPVVEVAFEKGPRYYIETSTGQLSAISGRWDQSERFSFSNLHMHHYWENWLGKEEGKTVQKYFLAASTLGLLLLVMTGIIIYYSRRLKKGGARNHF